MSLSAAIALERMSCCSGSQLPAQAGAGSSSVSSVSSAIAELAIASGDDAGPNGLEGVVQGEGCRRMLFPSMLLFPSAIVLEKSAMLQTISASLGGGWGRVRASEGRQC